MEGTLAAYFANKKHERAEHILCDSKTLDHRRYLLFGNRKLTQNHIELARLETCNTLMQYTMIVKWVLYARTC